MQKTTKEVVFDKNINIHFSDSRLLELMKENNLLAWNCIYDKYAALMYGNILNITRDKLEAEKIFVAAFRLLKDKNIPFPSHCSLSNFLCKYAKDYTIKNKPLSII